MGHGSQKTKATYTKHKLNEQRYTAVSVSLRGLLAEFNLQISGCMSTSVSSMLKTN